MKVHVFLSCGSQEMWGSYHEHVLLVRRFHCLPNKNILKKIHPSQQVVFVYFMLQTKVMWVLLWLVFVVLQLLPIIFTKQNSCCGSKYTIKNNILKSILKVGPPLIYLWLSKVRVCGFFDCIHRSSQLHSLLSWCSYQCLNNIVQPNLNICLNDVCSLILTNPPDPSQVEMPRKNVMPPG